MYIDNLSDIEKVIKDQGIEGLRKNINSDTLYYAMSDYRFDLIEQIYNYYGEDFDIEQYIFCAVLKTCAGGRHDAGIHCLDKYIKNKEREFSHEDDDDSLYYLSHYDSEELIQKLLELKTDIPWEYVLEISSAHLCVDSVKYLTKNIEFDKKDVNIGFGNIITSSIIDGPEPDERQLELFFHYLKNLKADVNIKQRYFDWGNLYLESFFNYPELAKYFYTKRFDPENLLNGKFWTWMFDKLLKSEKHRLCYIEPIRNLKESNVDLEPLIRLLDELGYKDKADEFLR